MPNKSIETRLRIPRWEARTPERLMLSVGVMSMKIRILAICVCTLALSGCTTPFVTVDEAATAQGAEEDYLCISPESEGFPLTSFLMLMWTLCDINLICEMPLRGTMTTAGTREHAGDLLLRTLDANGYGLVDWNGIYVVRTKEQIRSSSEKTVTRIDKVWPVGDYHSHMVHRQNKFYSESLRFCAAYVAARWLDLNVEIPEIEGSVTVFYAPEHVDRHAMLDALLRLRDLELVTTQTGPEIRKRTQPEGTANKPVEPTP